MKAEREKLYEPGDVVALYAERLALHTNKSKSCVALLSKYASERESETREYIKQICAGKYPLQYILSLLEPQMIQAVRNMAAILCAGYNLDVSFFGQLEKTYSTNYKKENLLPLEADALESTYEKAFKSGDATMGLQSFFDDSLNVVSRAFYFVYALCRVDEYTEEKYRAIGQSAVAAIELPRLQEKEPQTLSHPERFKYLYDNIAKPYFCAKSMGAIYRRDVQSYSASLKVNACVAGIAELFASASRPTDDGTLGILVAALQHSGIMQEDRFNTMVLSKEEISRLSHVAYCNSGLDLVSTAVEDVWINDKGDAKTRWEAERVLQLYKSSLTNLVYDTYFCESIKRLTLANIEKTFFSPEGARLRSELTAARKQAERAEAFSAKCSEQLKASESKMSNAEKAASDARNKVAGLQSKVDKQQAEIDALKAKLVQSEAALKKAQEAIALQTRPGPEEASEALPQEENTPDYAAVLTDIFAQKTIVFIGGNPSVMQKLSLKYPDAVVIPQNRIPTAEQQIVSADAILFKTDSMAHKDYTPVKALAEKRRIPYGYIGDITNLALLEQDIAVKLAKILEAED